MGTKERVRALIQYWLKHFWNFSSIDIIKLFFRADFSSLKKKFTVFKARGYRNALNFVYCIFVVQYANSCAIKYQQIVVFKIQIIELVLMAKIFRF